MNPIDAVRGLAVAALLLVAAAAQAAPQILGVMANAEPVALLCNKDECSAVIGTFCLQRERDIPRYGAPYRVATGAQLTLIIETAAGEVRRLPGQDWLSFAGYDGYTTARMILSRDALAKLGATNAAVVIGPSISLVPVAQFGDTDPQSADEIMTATGALRIAAGRYLDRPTVQADAARLVMALVNAIPERRTIRDRFDGVWDATIGVAPPVSSDALARARNAFDRCTAQRDMFLRGCLLSRHRSMMQPENRQFWDETSGY